MSKYSHRVTLACPESLIPQANQLALIAGESAGDDQTFNTPSYQDSFGNKYSVASTVTTSGFLGVPARGLPENPSYAEDADRAAAQEALGSIGTDGGLMMAVDVAPEQALSEWGLTPIPVDVV